MEPARSCVRLSWPQSAPEGSVYPAGTGRPGLFHVWGPGLYSPPCSPRGCSPRCVPAALPAAVPTSLEVTQLPLSKGWALTTVFKVLCRGRSPSWSRHSCGPRAVQQPHGQGDTDWRSKPVLRYLGTESECGIRSQGRRAARQGGG